MNHPIRRPTYTALIVSLVAVVVSLSTLGQSQTRLETIKLPPGFRISVFAEGVTGARSMTISPGGVLFVGTQRAGSVYAMADRNKDGKADRVVTVAQGLNTPNGVAFRNGSLYVAEVNRILRFDDIEARLDSAGPPVVVHDGLPSDRMHGWKFIRFGPDGLLYVPVGAPCNICEPREIYASILRMKPDGTGREIFARGVRNTVGFDWHPTSRELWFTDNGRDNLGDDVPNDELNRAPKAGLHFGYPYCHQGDTPDPEFGAKRKCGEFEPPAARMGPHVAAIGMRFYTGPSFPKQYYRQAFIAQHGSWNRSDPIGYRVMVAHIDGGKVVQYEPFAEGWLQGREAWGRPVDVEVAPDGSLLVSDDRVGAIYRISYQGN